MITIGNITVRLGGRTILDKATASIPPGSRVGLIGRNGAGKSTLMKVLVGELDPDEGSIEMPRRTRLGYIAQEAPSGALTPFETVLAADTERARLLDEAEHCTDPDRLGDIHERLLAIDAYTAPSRAAITPRARVARPRASHEPAPHRHRRPRRQAENHPLHL